MTDMEIHKTWTSSSAAEQELAGRRREAQVYLAWLAPVPALFSALIDGARGRSGKLITPAEASGRLPTPCASRPYGQLSQPDAVEIRKGHGGDETPERIADWPSVNYR